MDDIALREQHKYETIWKSVPEYRVYSPADRWIPVFFSFFYDQFQKGDMVLDFGCGSGRSALPLLKADFKVHLVDITIEALDPATVLLWRASSIHFTESCLWDLSANIKPEPWILCFDVLEHIPPEKIESVLLGISSRMQKGGLFSICLKEDEFGQIIDDKLHLTVQSADWWKGKISKFFDSHKELFNNGIILLLQVTN